MSSSRLKKSVSYFGDVSCRHGGYWVNLEQAKAGDWADVVRVTPVSDWGGPDNVFLVESLTVDTGQSTLEKYKDMLAVIGYDESVSGPADIETIIEASLACGTYTIDEQITVRIGPAEDIIEKETEEEESHYYKVLRAGSSLRNYVVKTYANYL